MTTPPPPHTIPAELTKAIRSGKLVPGVLLYHQSWSWYEWPNRESLDMKPSAVCWHASHIVHMIKEDGLVYLDAIFDPGHESVFVKALHPEYGVLIGRMPNHIEVHIVPHHPEQTTP